MEIEGKSWKSMEKHKSFDFLKVNNRRPSSDDCSCAQIYSNMYMSWIELLPIISLL